jgi:rubredoxin
MVMTITFDSDAKTLADAPAAATLPRRFMCMVCGYVYDEAAGDPASGIAPHTRWEALPEGWACPECGAPKCDFEELDASA